MIALSDYRQHHASRGGPPSIIFVPVPYEIGSPKTVREAKPRYPRQDRQQPWRPAQQPPCRTKGEATKRLIERMGQQDNDIRAFMEEARRSAG